MSNTTEAVQKLHKFKLKVIYPPKAPDFALMEDEKRNPIGSVFEGDTGKEQAEFIAKAVNNHYKLIEALNKCAYQLQTYVESNAWDAEDDKAYDNAMKLIQSLS